MLRISEFSVSEGFATLTINTNICYGIPFIEQCKNLLNQQWITDPNPTVSIVGTNYIIVVSAPADAKFYRAVCVGGEHKITSYARHYAPYGLVGDLDGNAATATSLSAGTDRSRLDNAISTTGNVTRSGTLGGSSAILTNDYVTLQQAQNVASRSITLYLHGSRTNAYGGGYLMDTDAGTSNSNIRTVSNTVSNQYVFIYMSPTNGLGLTEMQGGTYTVSCQMRASGNGARGKWEAYVMDNAGTGVIYEIPESEIIPIPTTQSKMQFYIQPKTNIPIHSLLHRLKVAFKEMDDAGRSISIWTENGTPATFSGNVSSGTEVDPIASAAIITHDGASNAHTDLFAQKAGITNVVTIFMTNLVISGSIDLGGMILKGGLNRNGTNGVIVMQPNDANEYMIWLPPPPQ
jgi:hypothetical protein